MKKVLCVKEFVMGGREEYGEGHYKSDGDFDVKFIEGKEYDSVEGLFNAIDVEDNYGTWRSFTKEQLPEHFIIIQQ